MLPAVASTHEEATTILASNLAGSILVVHANDMVTQVYASPVANTAMLTLIWSFCFAVRRIDSS